MNSNETWIARAIEGDLDPTELLEFRRMLEGDPAMREELGKHAVLHGLLGPALEGENERERWLAASLGAIRAADQERFAQGVQQKILRVTFQRRLFRAAAASVVLAIGLSLWTMIPRPVATIVSGEAAGDESTLQQGSQFFKGDRMRLKSGLMEVDLMGRGRVIVEGPAELVWGGPLGLTLHKGRVLLRVNERGHGYRIDTPKGSVIDLGTEFGVSVDPGSGEVETHVLKGEVKALPGDGSEAIRLVKNEALRFSKDRNQRITADLGAFYRTMPPPHGGNRHMVHWSMEPDGKGIVPSRTRGLGEETFHLELREGWQPMEGPFGKALSFDGKTAYAETHYRGISGTQARTVAFWVKIPRNHEPFQGFAMVSWGNFNKEVHGSVWQISANPLEKDGPVGRLRVGVHGGKVIGSTDLRDDAWHHVAVVLYPSADPDFGQHVMIYVDGQPESVSSRTLGRIDTEVDSASHGVWLGRNVVDATDHGRFFCGGIDEVYIFDAALTQSEILALKTENLPPE